MNETLSSFHHLFLMDIRRRLFDESAPRIRKCLASLSEEEVWYRPNGHSNSVGNLVLHLCGNARQWVVSGLGGAPDTRRRQAEFDERGPLSTPDLLALLDATLAEVATVLDALTPTALVAPCRVQGFDETGISILIHVVEHFSYHVGQITYITKWLRDMDMGYYAGLDLEG